MADKEIKIMFPEEKWEALSFFMGQKDETIEAALTEYINKTYEKNVPAPVRQFMDRGNAGNQTEAQQPAGADRTTNNNGTAAPVRRNQRSQRAEGGTATSRTNRRTQAQQSAGQTAEPDAAAGQIIDGQEETQETGQGMTLVM
jgi:hypothetical protein